MNENKLLVEALKSTKQYFVAYEGNTMSNVSKLACLLVKIDTALASAGELSNASETI